MSRLEYYKPGFLTLGLMLFGLSMLFFGYFMRGGFTENVWIPVIIFIGIFTGEVLILEASSYKRKEEIKDE